MTKDRANDIAFEIYMTGGMPSHVTKDEKAEVHQVMIKHPGWTFHDALLELC